MSVLRNPFVWLCRIRHRRGYGIHSPFAYDLVTQVLYNPGTYYAYRLIDRLLPWPVRTFGLRPRAVHRLLFRLANRWQPRLIAAPGGVTPAEWNSLHEGCRHAVIDPGLPRGVADMLLLTRRPCDGWQTCVGEGTMLVILDLQQSKSLWEEVRRHPATRVTFDLYDVGVAVCDPKLQRQHYVINW